MSAEAAIAEAVARVAVAILGPAIEEALRGGEPEADVIRRLSALPSPTVRDTTAEDAARRARLSPALQVVRELAAKVYVTPPQRIAILALAADAEHRMRTARAEDDTREVPT